jgi:inner membrane protein involved in colicin E2 resistance
MMSGLNRINPLAVKILLIALLTLVLLVPLSRVESLIAERAALRDGAVERVANGVGHTQRIGALMMVVPVTRTWVGSERHPRLGRDPRRRHARAGLRRGE